MEQVADHPEEPIQVAGIGEFVLADVDVYLKIAPGVDDLHLLLLDLASAVPGVRHDQLGRLLLDRLNLSAESDEIVLEIGESPLKGGDRLTILAQVIWDG